MDVPTVLILINTKYILSCWFSKETSISSSNSKWQEYLSQNWKEKREKVHWNNALLILLQYRMAALVKVPSIWQLANAGLPWFPATGYCWLEEILKVRNETNMILIPNHCSLQGKKKILQKFRDKTENFHPQTWPQLFCVDV